MMEDLYRGAMDGGYPDEEHDEKKESLLEKLIEDEELKAMFGYVHKELRLAYLTPRQEYLVSKTLSLIYRTLSLGKYNDLDLRPAAEYLYADVIAIIVPSRARGGFERKMQVTSRHLTAEEERKMREEERKRFGFLFGR